MVYQPLHALPDGATRQSTSRPLSANQDRYTEQTNSGIRAVDYADAYDDADFIGDERRPPSFRSHDDHHHSTSPSGAAGGGPAGAGLYLGDHAELTYDNILAAASAAAYDRAPSRGDAPRQVYDPDLEVRLEPPAPLYISRRPDSRDWEEDVKDPAEFEQSYDAGGGGDDSRIEHEIADEDDGLHSPALSFQGGFGAPPPVSASLIPELPVAVFLWMLMPPSTRRPHICDARTCNNGASSSPRATSSSRAPSRPVYSASCRARTRTSSRRVATRPSPAGRTSSTTITICCGLRCTTARPSC